MCHHTDFFTVFIDPYILKSGCFQCFLTRLLNKNVRNYNFLHMHGTIQDYNIDILDTILSVPIKHECMCECNSPKKSYLT